MVNDSELPIGVFDSGVGGLTVLKALRQHLPEESFIYLGDTAHLPYGNKSRDTICHYSEQVVDLLLGHGIKLLIVACNTASTLALSHLQQCYPQLPILGMLQPGAMAACAQTKNNHIAVIATEATINAQAYQQAITALKPSAKVSARACALFVALAEEGWHHHDISLTIANEYLAPLFAAKDVPDTLVLGCTHFPLLTPVIKQVVADDISIIDSAEVSAVMAKQLLTERELHCRQNIRNPQVSFFVSDLPERFCRVGQQFFDDTISLHDIELVALPQ